MATRTQRRSECAACGQDCAVDTTDHVSVHGYTIQWGYFNGRCPGSNRKHFFTKEGKKHLEDNINCAEKTIKEIKKKYDVESFDFKHSFGPSRMFKGELTEKHKMGIARQNLWGAQTYIKQSERRLEDWREENPYCVEVAKR